MSATAEALLPLACALTGAASSSDVLRAGERHSVKATLLLGEVDSAQRARQGEGRVRAWAVAGSLDTRWLSQQARSVSGQARVALAANRATDPRTLDSLSRDESARVRRAALMNASLSSASTSGLLLYDPLLLEGLNSREQALIAGMVLRRHPQLAGQFTRHVLPAVRAVSARSALNAEQIGLLYSPAHRSEVGRTAFITNPLLPRRAEKPAWYPQHDSGREKARSVLTPTGRLRPGSSPAACARIGSDTVDAALADAGLQGRISSESCCAVIRAWAARERQPAPDVLCDIVNAGGLKAAREAMRCVPLPLLETARRASLLLEAAWPLLLLEAPDSERVREAEGVWAAAHSAKTLLRGGTGAWALLVDLSAQGRLEPQQIVELAHDVGSGRTA